jgi:hypothetical protein
MAQVEAAAQVDQEAAAVQVEKLEVMDLAVTVAM